MQEEKRNEAKMLRRVEAVCRRLGCAPSQICDLHEFALFKEWRIHPARIEAFLAKRNPKYDMEASVEDNLMRIFGRSFAEEVRCLL